MGIIRNFINILGITPEEELPDNILGQIIKYSEVETIFIPIEKPGIKSIYEIMVDIEIKSNRIINSPLGNTVVFDGIKNFKIVYTEDCNSEKASILHISTPYNTFIEIPNNVNYVDNIRVYILDAYFDLLSERNIYSHLVYLVDVRYANENQDSEEKFYSEDKKLLEMALSEDTFSEIREESQDNNIIDIDAEYM